ncbi:hypothetical protein NDU88_003598 [Pleurodeles waltl]|uniref:Uncharacterized protein n=1 Tax=Pleurodeles waltl TaxID=8319 RepID=A0AAV7W5U8_PLEWA|nr:hypothetical protein NDU88_003598 [Pleurodeles waltl]
MAGRLGRVSFSRGPRFGVFWFDHYFLAILHQYVTPELLASFLAPVWCLSDPRRIASAAPGSQQDPVGPDVMRGAPRRGWAARYTVLPEIPGCKQ